ncbi:E3 SUMO-protein ligase NSE2-like isoform X2 [Homarus americanus]|uniref:E3 SUMO-protein ligase NSE2-like isoform X2 n=1 Tax=Homarus americanus TaxID=6706 RepID=UPI001C436F59|nr:E3 SUMO-protein ligase NSE2-like isoform X2 [Homarus americanus]XP_042225927.1 E3 SUMO-protein ligase NSE2-like isoform X2 [Homarus americanus]
MPRPKEDIFSKNVEKTVGQVKRCAFSVLKYVADDDLKSKHLSDLEQVLVMCVEAKHSVAISREAAKEAEGRAKDDTNDESDVEKYEEAYLENLEELKQDINMQTVINKDPNVMAFRKQLMAQVVPAMVTRDEDLVTTQETINYIDPISKKTITDPVRNIHCGHVYDRASVISMIQGNKRKGFRCPSMGCAYRVRLAVTDLEDALDVKRNLLLQAASGKM